MSSFSLQILANILKCVFVFYSIYYAVGSLFFAGFKLQYFDGRIPFDFKTWIDLSVCCTVGYPSHELVNVLSMEVTFAASGLIFGAFIIRWVWDYSVTITVIHTALSCLVMIDFPLNWSWWVSLGFGLFMMISLGEAVSFVRREKKRVQIHPDTTTEPQIEPQSYIYRKA